jgi:hypothetical protein
MKDCIDVMTEEETINNFIDTDGVNYLKLKESSFVETRMRLSKSISQELSQRDERKYGYCFYNASTTATKDLNYVEGFVLHDNKLYEHGWNKKHGENLLIDVTFPKRILDSMCFSCSCYLEILCFNHNEIGTCIRQTKRKQPFFLHLEKYLHAFIKAKEIVRALFPNADYKDQYTSKFGKY